MQYSEGSTGRVFVVKFEDKEDPVNGLFKLAKEKKIKAAYVQLIGALRSAEYVSGPKDSTLPVVQVWDKIDKPRELFAVGTIFNQDNQPKLHLHGGLSREDLHTGGCIRQGVAAFILVEAVVVEIQGVTGERKFSEKLGLHILELDQTL